jgi:hypothetical protein
MSTLPSLVSRAEGPRTPIRPALIAALVLCLASAAHAQSATQSSASEATTWRLSGFGTLGLVHADVSQPWRFAREITQRGADGQTSVLPDTRLGLQLNWQPASRWEVVTQAVIRPRVHDAHLDESLEMAFVAWHPSVGWTVRAGRLKPDLFLLSNVRDVGYAMPWVRPSVEFYGWNPTTSLDGATLAYNWSADDADWTAQLWAGAMRSALSAMRTDGDIGWRGHRTAGFTLSRTTGGLTVKASLVQTDTELTAVGDLPLLEGLLTQVAQLPLPEVANSARLLHQRLIPDGRTHYLGLGAEYDSSTWMASSELSHVTVERGLTGGVRGYASVGRHFGPVTGYAMAAFSQPRHAAPRVQGDWETALTPLLGAAEAQTAAMMGAYAEIYAADARFDQHTLSLGMRWEMFDRAALKLQLDHTRVDAFGAGQWRHGDTRSATANILSAALDWVF